jgi:hypothetical protein
MRILLLITSHTVAALMIAIAGVWYGVVTFGLTTPQWIYNLIGSGAPMPVLGLGFIAFFTLCVLAAKYLFQRNKNCVFQRSAYYLSYTIGSIPLFLAGMWLTTLNPMVDLPAALAEIVIAGTPVTVIAAIMCLTAIAVIAFSNRFLAR